MPYFLTASGTGVPSFQCILRLRELGVSLKKKKFWKLQILNSYGKGLRMEMKLLVLGASSEELYMTLSQCGPCRNLLYE